MDEQVLVSKSELYRLLEESVMLTALLGLDVQNWDYFEESYSIYLASKDDIIAKFYEDNMDVEG
jgi:hypothetical protein